MKSDGEDALIICKLFGPSSVALSDQVGVSPEKDKSMGSERATRSCPRHDPPIGAGPCSGFSGGLAKARRHTVPERCFALNIHLFR